MKMNEFEIKKVDVNETEDKFEMFCYVCKRNPSTHRYVILSKSFSPPILCDDCKIKLEEKMDKVIKILIEEVEKENLIEDIKKSLAKLQNDLQIDLAFYKQRVKDHE